MATLTEHYAHLILSSSPSRTASHSSERNTTAIRRLQEHRVAAIAQLDNESRICRFENRFLFILFELL